jgi:hypothetical protein
MQERKLTKPEAKAKERIVKDLKGAKADFKKRYGKDAEAVMYATATKRAKKIAEADLGTVEPIVSALILIFGSIGIKVGFDQLIKLTDKYVAPAIDRFYGKVGAGAEFTRKHLKALYSAYTQGKEELKDKVIELLNISSLDEGGCGCDACQAELEEKKTKRDRCLRIADRKFKKPSAYKSGAVVRCRKGNIWKGVKEAYEQLDEKEKETLRTWFKRRGAPGKTGGWVDCNTGRKDPKTGKMKYKPCGRQKGEKRAKYPSCRPTPGKCKDKGKGKTWGKTK